MLERHDFLEIGQTPILTRATPEGARDFLVPSRLQHGSFYALPQSPQIFKQLLMIGGLERYYQIARCFRDEDQRADRQPEFTQLDLEMAFVTEEEVIAITEAVMSAVFALGEFELPPPPWPRLPFDEAIGRFGSDRPDRRFGLELHDVGELVRGSEFRVFESVLGSAGVVWALNAGARELSRSELDGLNAFVQRFGAAAVAPITVEGSSWRGNLARFFRPEQITSVNAELDAGDGDLLLFVADRRDVAARALGALRLELGERFALVDHSRHDVLWIVSFPMFERDGEGRWTAVHHPFTSPSPADGADRIDFSEPGALRSRAYDLVVDGAELGGGSIRTHSPDLQERVFEVLGLTPSRRRVNASASCWTRCVTVPRHTAGSLSASTGSWRRSPGMTRSARSSRSPRPPAARIRFRALPPPSTLRTAARSSGCAVGLDGALTRRRAGRP